MKTLVVIVHVQYFEIYKAIFLLLLKIKIFLTQLKFKIKNMTTEGFEPSPLRTAA